MSTEWVTPGDGSALAHESDFAPAKVAELRRFGMASGVRFLCGRSVETALLAPQKSSPCRRCWDIVERRRSRQVPA